MTFLRTLAPAAGTLCALAATALWSGNFIVARGLADQIPPVSLAFSRWLVAVLVMTPFAWSALRRDAAQLRRQLPYLGLTALLGITCFNTLIYLAGRTTAALNLSLISITFPVMILLLGRLLYGERIGGGRWAGILLVLSGVLLLLTGGDPGRLLQMQFASGDLWMLAAALLFAVYSLLLKRRPPGVGILSLQYATFALGLLFLLPLFALERAVMPPLVLTPGLVGAIAYVGIGASLLAFIAWHQAVDSIGPARAGMLYYTLPLFCSLWARLFLGEATAPVHLLSAALIIPGILIANRRSRESRRCPEADTLRRTP